MIYLFPILVGVIILVSLVGLLNPTFIVTLIKFNNQIKGVKSEITPLTIKMARIGCILGFLMGIFMLYNFFTNFLPNYTSINQKINSVNQTIDQNNQLVPPPYISK